MTDDTERRLHESLHGANLPAAPESLRDVLEAVAASPAPVAPRRTWLRALPALPALAAVVVLAIVAGTMTGGFGRLGTAVVSPSGSASAAPSAGASKDAEGTPIPTPTMPPRPAAPPTSVDVKDAASLRDDISLVKAGGEIPHDVVVNLGATPAATATARTCADGQSTCTVVGVLDEFNAVSGSVVVRTEVHVVPPPIDGASLRAPLALHIAVDGSLELIGHIDLTAGTGRLDMTGLRARTPTASAGQVVAVLGWLGQMLSPSCGPYLGDTPQPFECPGQPSFLYDSPIKAVTVNEHPSQQPGTAVAPVLSATGNLPDTVVLVGAASYQAFAPSPFVDGFNAEPREGLYLLRFVTVDTVECPKCRGWLVVGRLDLRSDATANNSPTFNAGIKTYSPDEIEALLTADRSAWIDKAVIVNGSVSPVDRLKCQIVSAGCLVGKLVDTSEWVEASSYTSQLAGGITGGTMAMRVREDGLEFLGLMGGGFNGVDNQATVDWLRGSSWSGDNTLTAFIVKGWLVAAPAHPCPLEPGAAPPPDTPFVTCPGAWLTPVEEQPTTLDTNEMTVNPPKDGVMVQYGAYRDFAPHPSTGALPEPRAGSYLVRLLVDFPGNSTAQSGWQVVARLSP